MFNRPGPATNHSDSLDRLYNCFVLKASQAIRKHPLMSLQSCTETRRNILIIGGGVFGLSSAWHLLNDRRNDVTICDHVYNVAPSRDVSKIIRIDYPDPERMEEVIGFKHLWENDDVFKPFYQHTGRVAAYSSSQIETLHGIDRARSQLALPARKHETAQLLQDLFGSKRVTQELTVVHNEDDGIVDWTGAMKSVKEDCVKKGGKFRDDRVLRFITRTSGRVQAVVTSSDSIDTERTEIILAAGPWIMYLLEASSIQQPPASRAPIATGIFSLSLDLNTEQWKKYRNLPVASVIGVGT